MTSIEQLEAQHQAELTELETQIASLKLSGETGKIDKKKKKALNAKIDNLKRELEIRQENEMYELKVKLIGDGNDFDSHQLEEPKIPEPSITPVATKPKPNRNKAKKERKEAELLKKMAEAELEAKDLPNLRKKENEALSLLVDKANLQVHEIPPDGHCLYSAISDQLHQIYSLEFSALQVRKKASEYIRSNPGDFLPFLTNTTGDMLSELEFQEYCDSIANSATWGGQIEITALSKAYEVPVTVFQVGSPSLTISKEDWPEKKPLNISYHRHAFGLGAHYNSLRIKP